MEPESTSFGLTPLDTSNLRDSLKRHESSSSQLGCSDDSHNVELLTPGARVTNSPRTPMALPRRGAPLLPRSNSEMEEMGFHVVPTSESGGQHQPRCLDIAKQSFKCISDAKGNSPCGNLFDNYMMCRRYSIDSEPDERFPS